MKKFAALLTGSYREFKSVRTLTACAMLAAVAVLLGLFTIQIGTFVKISFSSIPNGIVGHLFGPVVGSVFAAVADILGYIVRPTGAYFLPLTLVKLVAGFLYGIMYYGKKLTFVRILITEFLVLLICNVILNTLCLSLLYGNGFFVLLPARALKNLIMWPIDTVIFYAVSKALGRIPRLAGRGW